jgi:hypothetical protein
MSKLVDGFMIVDFGSLPMNICFRHKNRWCIKTAPSYYDLAGTKITCYMQNHASLVAARVKDVIDPFLKK